MIRTCASVCVGTASACVWVCVYSVVVLVFVQRVVGGLHSLHAVCQRTRLTLPPGRLTSLPCFDRSGIQQQAPVLIRSRYSPCCRGSRYIWLWFCMSKRLQQLSWPMHSKHCSYQLLYVWFDPTSVNNETLKMCLRRISLVYQWY